ncbi:MAG TPA: hypothetical protein VMV46_01525, partial [Thermoanaerobaculia bacterium]|nr:hypothetical protein [Thermoanaerobaculia bacterium]
TAAPGSAAEITFTTANDILSGNRFSDDRYTAALVLGFHFERFELRFEENLFTDRENGLRFDESWLTARFAPQTDGPWRPTFEVGVVHVGEGLFGESAQNAIHRLIGGERVELPYTGHDTFHAVARVDMRRTLLQRDRLEVEAGFGGSWSPAFRSTLETEVQAAIPTTRWLTVILGVGGRMDRTELDALEPWQHDTAMTGELGFLLRDRVQLSWLYNAYGTTARHLRLTYRIPTGGRERGRR